MQCLRLTEWGGELELADVPTPSVGPTEVLLDVEATSVGRTVYNNTTGYVAESDEALPLIPGHEIVGRVAETGEGVTCHDEGDLVAAYYYLSCGHCQACRRGLEPLCEDSGGRLGVDRDGGFAEFVALPHANVVPIPEMDPVAATVIPDAVATPYHVATKRANVKPGDEVMVLGAGGGVGIHLVQVAKHFGGTVTAVDLDRVKLERCAVLGAAHTLNTQSESIVEYADREGLRYDTVVDFTGVMSVVEEAIDALAPRGRLVNLTAFRGRTFEFAPRSQVLGETEVVGSRYCSKYELRRAADLIVDGAVEPVVSEVVGLDGVPALLDSIAADEVVGRGAVVP